MHLRIEKNSMRPENYHMIFHFDESQAVRIVTSSISEIVEK